MARNKALSEEINRKLYKYDRMADYIDTIEDVNEEQILFYRRQGYIAVRHLLNASEIRDATDAIMQLIEMRSRMSKDRFDAQFVRINNKVPYVQLVKPDEQLHTLEEAELAVRKVGDFVDFDPRLYAVAMHKDVIKTVARLLGDKPKLVQEQALLKPPYGGEEKPWHQDMAYRGLNFNMPVVGVWIALDEAGIENGCMHVIPRSHMDGGTPHYAVRDWQICDENVSVNSDTVVPLQPGGALFFHGMLHHGTPSNFSAKRRRAVQFHYAPESAEWVTPQEYKRMFTNQMSGAEC